MLGELLLKPGAAGVTQGSDEGFTRVQRGAAQALF
jgi:hypothetical protein